MEWVQVWWCVKGANSMLVQQTYVLDTLFLSLPFVAVGLRIGGHGLIMRAMAHDLRYLYILCACAHVCACACAYACYMLLSPCAARSRISTSTACRHVLVLYCRYTCFSILCCITSDRRLRRPSLASSPPTWRPSRSGTSGCNIGRSTWGFLL